MKKNTQTKDEIYNWVVNILKCSNDSRKDNRKLLKNFYWNYFGLTLDEAFENNDVPNYQTIERAARRVKQLYPNLRYDKSQQIDKYKQIGLDIPYATRLF